MVPVPMLKAPWPPSLPELRPLLLTCYEVVMWFISEDYEVVRILTPLSLLYFIIQHHS